MDLYKKVGELIAKYKDTIQDFEFFTSNIYQQYIWKKTKNILMGCFYTLQNMGFSITNSEEQEIVRGIHTKVDFNTEKNDNGQIPVSYTKKPDYFGNRVIYLNAAGPRIQFQKELLYRHIALIGTLYHEIGHILFTDFPTINAWTYELQNGRWFPKAPVRAATADGVNLIARIQSDPEMARLVCKIAFDINNIGEDGYVEREISEFFPGDGKQSLALKNEYSEVVMGTVEEYLQTVTPYQAIISAFLDYSRYGYMKMNGYDGQYASVLYDGMEILEGFKSRDPLDRVSAVNELMCLLQPYLDDEIERLKKQEKQQKQKSGSSGQPSSSKGQQTQQQGGGQQENQGQNQQDSNGSSQGNQNSQSGQQNGQQGQGSQNGNNSLSKDIVDKILGNIQAKMEKMGTQDHQKSGQVSRALNNPNSSRNQNVPDSVKQQQPANSAGGAGTSADGSIDTSAAKRSLDSLLANVVKNKAEKQAEEDRTKELNKNAQNLDGTDYGVGNSKVQVVRASDVSVENMDAYDKAMETLAPISKDLRRGIERVLKDRREGGKRKNLPFGRRLEVTSIVHGDGKYFSKNKLPTESPKLGVGLLIDESGSTSGNLIDAATSTALVIDDFCRELDIPCIINGYTSQSSKTMLLSYSEPDTVDNKDKYRLTGIHSRGGTPTKAALLYMANRMQKLPVDVRLLIVITDGESSDNYQNGTIQDIIKNAKKKSMMIIAAGIGTDRKKVEDEFGKDNFVDISDLKKMPMELTQIIKANIWV